MGLLRSKNPSVHRESARFDGLPLRGQPILPAIFRERSCWKRTAMISGLRQSI
jgi:hypothetical protein